MKRYRILDISAYGKVLVLLAGAALFLGVFLHTQKCYAIEATELEPAGDLDPGMLKIEGRLQYEKYDEYELVLENSIEYDFSKKWRLELTAPLGKMEHEKTEIEDTELEVKYVFNPDSETFPVVALEFETLFPTAKHSHGIDESVCLFLDQHLGKSEWNHQLHLNFAETFIGGAEEEDRRFRYEAIAGYSVNLTPQTSLTADFIREQLEEHGENSNIIEAGLKHEFNDTFAIAGGVGHGIGEESPEWQAQLGFEIRLGLKKNK